MKSGNFELTETASGGFQNKGGELNGLASVGVDAYLQTGRDTTLHMAVQGRYVVGEGPAISNTFNAHATAEVSFNNKVNLGVDADLTQGTAGFHASIKF